ncbi:Quinone oxidoreductase [hydrothermal vent metagenome]|uniref:Quinone oxidoreductase n=1 Tax=hydrothermal vent metagenome TaxID=652676 RepID=A0A3B0UTS0_9ZZZZ
MNKAIRIQAYGGVEVLDFTDLALKHPGKGEILLRHTAIGVNFIDTYHRSGLYPLQLPFVPGQEAAGVVEEIGEGVDEVDVGDRIVYFSPPGAYSQRRIMPARNAIPIPDWISDKDAAAIYLKGMTARYLLVDTFKVKKGDVVLFHAAAGGVGQLACRWAKALGAMVIGTVGSDEKVISALTNGCDHAINLLKENFADRVKEITLGKGVDVVYDSIGKDSFEMSLDCLKPRGLMVSFGNSSGPVAVASLGILAAKGSLYLTRPTLAHYYPDRATEMAGAKEMFEALKNGHLHVHIGQQFNLADAAKAHFALENRQTTGATILLP